MNMTTAKFGGSFSDNKYLGDPSSIRDRQYASEGAAGRLTPGDVGDSNPGPTADIYMIPDFMGMSGEGANQSTDRGKGTT